MANRYPVIVTNTGAGDSSPFAFKEIPSGDDLLLTGNFIRIGSTSAVSDVIKDANGNTVISFPTAVASAVNYFRLNNSATGNSIVLEAVGGDTDVSITLKPKGSSGEIIVGNGAVAATVKSSGNFNLILKPGSSNAGTLTFNQGNNGDIVFSPHGTGKVKVGTNNVVTTGDTGTVSSGMIADTAISTAKIQDSAVTSAKIAATAVGTTKIEDSAVTSAKIAATAVGTTKIEDLAVTTAKIAATAVTTAKINVSATSKVLGRTTAGAGPAEELSITGSGNVVFATNPTISGITMADNTNIAISSTTGTKIGTATTDKIGFFNATPVAQRTAIASVANTATSTLIATAVNSIRAALTSLGLTA